MHAAGVGSDLSVHSLLVEKGIKHVFVPRVTIPSSPSHAAVFPNLPL
jgi:hypothetical protein